MTRHIHVQRKPFFYDAQIARILIQVGTKCFGGYQVVSGYQKDGKVRFTDVPVLYSGYSRVVQQMMGGISDNVVPRLPMMSYEVSSLRRKQSEIRDPLLVEQFAIRERKRDSDGNLLINEPGKIVIMERYMPVPYDMNIGLTIWASNTDQLMQLTEQLGSAFNPDQEFALSDTAIDWTSPTRLLFSNDIQFSEVTPAEKPDPIQTASMQFSTTIRLSLPVRVYDAALIHEIDVNIRELEDFGYSYFGANIDLAQMPLLDDLEIIATPQQIVDHEGQ